jgi:hypothetical protein
MGGRAGTTSPAPTISPHAPVEFNAASRNVVGAGLVPARPVPSGAGNFPIEGSNLECGDLSPLLR